MQSSCMYHNIHAKANVNYLLPTCARTAYQDIVYLSNFYYINLKTSSMPYIYRVTSLYRTKFEIQHCDNASGILSLYSSST